MRAAEQWNVFATNVSFCIAQRVHFSSPRDALRLSSSRDVHKFVTTTVHVKACTPSHLIVMLRKNRDALGVRRWPVCKHEASSHSLA